MTASTQKYRSGWSPKHEYQMLVSKRPAVSVSSTAISSQRHSQGQNQGHQHRYGRIRLTLSSKACRISGMEGEFRATRLSRLSMARLPWLGPGGKGCGLSITPPSLGGRGCGLSETVLPGGSGCGLS